MAGGFFGENLTFIRRGVTGIIGYDDFFFCLLGVRGTAVGATAGFNRYFGRGVGDSGTPLLAAFRATLVPTGLNVAFGASPMISDRCLVAGTEILLFEECMVEGAKHSEKRGTDRG